MGMKVQVLWSTVINGFQRLRLLSPELDLIIPTPEAITTLKTKLDKLLEKWAEVTLDARLRTWRARLCGPLSSEATAADRRCLANHMRPPRAQPISASKVTSATSTTIAHVGRHYAVRPADALQAPRETWTQIFNATRTLSWEAFETESRQDIRKAPCRIGKLDPEDYHRALIHLPKHRAVASCGYRVAEIHGLPMAITRYFAYVFQFIEEGADWRDILLEVYSSALCKDEKGDADGKPTADDLMFSSADRTRIINNYFPFVSAWQSARWVDANRWREYVLQPSMRGARAEREAAEVTLNHGFTHERQTILGGSSASLSIDWEKFFDCMGPAIGAHPLQAMRESEDTAQEAHDLFNAERRLLEQPRCRFELGRSLEKESTTMSS
eukprot:3833554-Pyramimonas_sp.AAC.1